MIQTTITDYLPKQHITVSLSMKAKYKPYWLRVKIEAIKRGTTISDLVLEALHAKYEYIQAH